MVQARASFPCCEVRLQAEQMIGGADQRADTALLHAELLQERGGLFGVQVDEIALDLRADHHRLAGEMGLHVFADLQHVRVPVRVRELLLLDIAREDRRLIAQEEQRIRERALFRRQAGRAGPACRHRARPRFAPALRPPPRRPCRRA